MAAKHGTDQIYIGEAYLKSEEAITKGFTIEDVNARRDIVLDVAHFEPKLTCFDDNKHPKTFIEDMVYRLDSYVWRDPDLETSQMALSHTKSLIELLFGYVRANWVYGSYIKDDVDLIETGSYFSNLRVGLPFEFDFMFDITDILSPAYEIVQVEDDKERNFISERPELRENIYYCIRLKDDCAFTKCSTIGMLFHVEEFCESLHKAFEDAIKFCKYEGWDIFDWSSPKTSPAFSFSMFYDETGILVDLVPCFRIEATDVYNLPKINSRLNTFFTENQWGSSTSHDDDKGSAYDTQPLYLICCDVDFKQSSGFNRYAEIYKGCTFRLSLSLFEKHFYRRLDSNISSALRVFKYLFQTFPSTLGDCNGVWDKEKNTKLKKKFDKQAKADLKKHKNRIRNNKYGDEQDPMVTFGCKSSIPSYFFTNFFLKLLSTGEFIQLWKGYGPGDIFLQLFSYLLKLLETIPSDLFQYTEHSPTVYHHVAVGSWFFEDRSFASKEVSLTDDQIFGLRSWLHAIVFVLSDPSSTSEIYANFPLRCILPRVECLSCKKHYFILNDDIPHLNIEEDEIYRCHIHRLAASSIPIGFNHVDWDDVWPGLSKYCSN
uniref:Mab-21-like nucleotidyltransferase domain-containing protein n=1 Tax=Clytia hemisphaerica TaxID=252671 RepID=A0A7M5WVS9_9CNID